MGRGGEDVGVELDESLEALASRRTRRCATTPHYR